MFDYLKAHDGPVVDGLEQYETVFAKNQPQYLQLRTLPGEDGNSAISRFHLTDEQRKAIFEGADIYLEILHFKQPLAPSRLMIMNQPSRTAILFKEWWKVQTKGTYPIDAEEAMPGGDMDTTIYEACRRISGRTLTQEQADYILSFVQGAVHGGRTTPAQAPQQQSEQKKSIQQ